MPVEWLAQWRDSLTVTYPVVSDVQAPRSIVAGRNTPPEATKIVNDFEVRRGCVPAAQYHEVAPRRCCVDGIICRWTEWRNDAGRTARRRYRSGRCCDR